MNIFFNRLVKEKEEPANQPGWDPTAEQAAWLWRLGGLVASIQAKRVPGGGWEAYCDNGRERTGRDALEWLEEVQERGAGEEAVGLGVGTTYYYSGAFGHDLRWMGRDRIVSNWEFWTVDARLTIHVPGMKTK